PLSLRDALPIYRRVGRPGGELRFKASFGRVESREDVARVGLIALLALLVAPPLSQGHRVPGGVAIVSRDLQVGTQPLASSAAPIRFDMVGLRWEGSGTVGFR